MTQLKPVSDMARRLLAKFGETPAQHQAQVLAIANKTYTKSHATSKVPDVHKLNRAVDAKLNNSLEPTSEVARRLETAKSFEEEWVPDVYVLFIRKYKCTTCGNSGSCVDFPSIFLRHRKRHLSPAADNSQGVPRIYLPVRVLGNKALPCVQEVRVATMLHCELCFGKKEGEVKCLQAQTSSSDTPTPSGDGTQANMDTTGIGSPVMDGQMLLVEQSLLPSQESSPHHAGA